MTEEVAGVTAWSFSRAMVERETALGREGLMIDIWCDLDFRVLVRQKEVALDGWCTIVELLGRCIYVWLVGGSGG